MLIDQLFLIIATCLFLGSAIFLVSRQATFSPQFISAVSFTLCGLFTLFPQLKYSSNRPYVLSERCQIFILLAAITFAVANLFVRKPVLPLTYPRVRWKLFPQSIWLSIFFLVCLSDPVVSWFRFGTVGLIQGHEGMGTGGGSHTEVYSPITYIAWSAGAISMCMVAIDYLTSSLSLTSYILRKPMSLALVAGSLTCNSLGGNRFIIVFQSLTLLFSLALFERLKVWMTVTVAILGMFFFVIIGNFRFGAIDITDNLDHLTGFRPYDLTLAWLTSYTEPIFPTLDNLLQNQPGISYGMNAVTSILPSSIVESLNLSRENNGPEYLSAHQLYAYHGLTFRTMYGDLVLDFGYKVSLLIGAGFFLLGAIIYNRSLDSHFRLLLFFVFSPLILFSPFIAGFYSLPNLASFAILLLVAPELAVQREEITEFHPKEYRS